MEPLIKNTTTIANTGVLGANRNLSEDLSQEQETKQFAKGEP